MNRFWTCWVKGTNGGYGYQHTTREDAVQEAERLAGLPVNQGREVYMLELVGCCKKPPPVQWEEIIPF